MKKLKICSFLIMLSSGVFAQLPSSSVFFDDVELAAYPGTSLVLDGMANKGTCLFRSSSSVASTMWFGPYKSLSAGSYQVSFRMKVADNTSGNTILKIDVVAATGGVIFSSFELKPNQFYKPNTWQLITIPLELPNDVSNIEFRGVAFQPGISDIYFDYVEVHTGAIGRLYANNIFTEISGNVGIGTATPNEKLAVNGKIRAKEIKVEASNWPDYVFEKGYKIVQLEELERYIQANKHLPEIPSAKEVESNGIELGQMNKILLKKVEELTLMLIDQNKKNKEYERSIDELKKKLERVEHKE